jgi:hypothetical protein
VIDLVAIGAFALAVCLAVSAIHPVSRRMLIALGVWGVLPVVAAFGAISVALLARRRGETVTVFHPDREDNSVEVKLETERRRADLERAMSHNDRERVRELLRQARQRRIDAEAGK